MNTSLWVAQVLLAVVFALTGGLKVSQPRPVLAGRMSWVEDATDAQVKTVGALELLAAIGLIVPPLVHIGTFLTPLAAVGVVCLMAGAIVTHVRMGEADRLWVPAVLLVVAVAVAIARFGPYAF